MPKVTQLPSTGALTEAEFDRLKTQKNDLEEDSAQTSQRGSGAGPGPQYNGITRGSDAVVMTATWAREGETDAVEGGTVQSEPGEKKQSG